MAAKSPPHICFECTHLDYTDNEYSGEIWYWCYFNHIFPVHGKCKRMMMK